MTMEWRAKLQHSRRQLYEVGYTAKRILRLPNPQSARWSNDEVAGFVVRGLSLEDEATSDKTKGATELVAPSDVSSIDD